MRLFTFIPTCSSDILLALRPPAYTSCATKKESRALAAEQKCGGAVFLGGATKVACKRQTRYRCLSTVAVDYKPPNPDAAMHGGAQSHHRLAGAIRVTVRCQFDSERWRGQ